MCLLNVLVSLRKVFYLINYPLPNVIGGSAIILCIQMIVIGNTGCIFVTFLSNNRILYVVDIWFYANLWNSTGIDLTL